MAHAAGLRHTMLHPLCCWGVAKVMVEGLLEPHQHSVEITLQLRRLAA